MEKVNKRAKEDEEWLRREHEWMTREQKKRKEIAALRKTVDDLWARQNSLKEELDLMEIILQRAKPQSPLTPQGYEEDGGEQSHDGREQSRDGSQHQEDGGEQSQRHNPNPEDSRRE